MRDGFFILGASYMIDTQMTKTDDYQIGVMGVIRLARLKNPEIGSYEMHFYNESFRLVAKLTNGRIEMSTEVAEDFERVPRSVNEETVLKVAGTFEKR